MLSIRMIREVTMRKKLVLGILALLAFLLTVTSALGLGTLPVRITEATINNDFVEPDYNSSIILEAGDHATLKVDFWSTKYLDDVRIEAFLAGASSTPVDRRTAVVTMDAMEESVIYTRRLSVLIPEDISPGDYTIVLSFSDDESSLVREYEVEVERPEHGIAVRDISISPEGTIKGGRTIAVRTEVYNFGKYTETVTIGAIIEGLNLEKQVTSMSVPKYTAKYTDSLYFTLPTCTPSGRYSLRGSIEYDNGLRRDVFVHSFDVSDNPECDLISSGGFYDDEQVIIGPVWERTVITVPPPQDAPRGGEEATYNIKISNEGKYARSYYLEIEGIEWAWSSISPSNLVVVEPGDSITISLGLRAKDTAISGTHIFTINVMSGSKLLEQISLGANVITDGQTGDYDPGMGGVTANVIKRAPGERVNLKAIGEVGVTLLVTLIVIGVTVLYFIRMDGEEEQPKPRTTHYYDNVYSRDIYSKET